MKNIFLIILVFLNVSCLSGGSDSSSKPGGGGDNADGGTADGSNSIIPGIGSGGSVYILGTLDGLWTTDCEGGANGDNWSYYRRMTISGNTVSIEEKYYVNNQNCSGAHDVFSLISMNMNWGSYDTAGYSNNSTFANHSWKLTPVTVNGLNKLNALTYGSCVAGSQSLNVQKECSLSPSGNFGYFVADNIFIPEGRGMQSSLNYGIQYAFGTYRKVLSSTSSYDGIYANCLMGDCYKVMISGDRFAYIYGGDSFAGYVFIYAGSFSEGAAGGGGITLNVIGKQKIIQPISNSGVSNLNGTTTCGSSNYVKGVVKNLLSGGNCTDTPNSIYYNLSGDSLSLNINISPNALNYGSPVLNKPWHY